MQIIVFNIKNLLVVLTIIDRTLLVVINAINNLVFIIMRSKSAHDPY